MRVGSLLSFIVTTPTTEPEITLRSLTTPGIQAVRRYWRPFLLLQGIALLLVIGYYNSEAVRRVCDWLSSIRQSSGLAFSALAAAIAGGLLPEGAKAIVLGERTITRKRVDDVTFAICAFAVNGVITDIQYRGLGWVFGNDAHFITAIKKMLVDQFITTPIYGIPYWAFVYTLRANRYNIWRTLRDLTPRWYLTRCVPLQLPAWAFWIPMVLLIYLLPGSLQFFLYVFAVAAWSLLMVFVATHESPAEKVDVVDPLVAPTETV